MNNSNSRKSSVSSNGVFYAETYHPIQAGSIDGTDIHPHDNAIYRAFLCSSAGLYDPTGDVKVKGDPFCTLFVARLSRSTTEHSLLKAMSKYGRVKNLRLVRDIVTGGSHGYAFVEYETEREMRRAYEDAHHSYVDDSEIIVDYNRQQLMPGWIPRRLGGGLGGKKESGQLRFGGRERPFRAPLRPIPYDDLERLGIPPPPEGRYMSRFQVPSPPQRKRNSEERERLPSSSKTDYEGKETSPNRRKRNSEERERLPSSSKRTYKKKQSSSNGRKRNSEERERLPSSSKRNYEAKEASLNRRKRNSEDWGTSSSRREWNPQNVRKSSSSSRRERISEDRETSSPRRKRSSGDSENRKDKHSPRHHKHRSPSPHRHHYEKP